MSPTTILERIRHLFASERSEHPGTEHLDSINDAFLRGTLKEPVQPMSDQELAHAIREFRAARLRLDRRKALAALCRSAP